MQYVITLDSEGSPVGQMEKQEAHLKGVFHLAFSIFIFRKAASSYELLIQQRALSKYHSGGLWTNTCCSHAEVNIPIKDTAQKRLKEEMGFSCPLQNVGTFKYKAFVGQGLIENELDHVFIGFSNEENISLNLNEASSCEWVSLALLEERLKNKPATFTAWFAPALKLALKIF